MDSSSLDFHSLVAQIYEAAADPDKWPELLDALAEFVERYHAVGQLADESGSIAQIAAEEGEPLSSPLSSLASTLKRIPSLTDAAAPGTETVPCFDDMNEVLLHHFKSALKVAQQLVDYEDDKEVVVSLLDRLPIALLVVNARGRVLESNTQARQILQQGNGLSICDGQLNTTDKVAAKRLEKAIHELASKAATSSESRALMLSTLGERQEQIMAFLTPVRGSDRSDSLSNVAIFFSWPKSQPLPVPTAIGEHYGLTPKEMEIAGLLARGYSVREIADERYVSENTIRTQVKSVMAKTKTTRQSELVKLILTGPASILDDAARNFQAPVNVNDKCQASMLLLADGRELAYQEYGDPNGIPLFYLHSVLGSRLEVNSFIDEGIVKKLGLRIISMDRPGFGLSDPKPDRKFLDWTSDLEQLADHLHLPRFCIAGYATGGVFACAAAHELHERIERVLVISSGVRATKRADFANTLPLYRMNMKLARDLLQVYRVLCSILRKGILRNPKRFFEQMAEKLSSEEKTSFNATVLYDSFYENLVAALQQGPYSFAREVEVLMQPWDFAPENIPVPVDIWHGDEDVHVPCDLDVRLARQLPHATLTILPGYGHFMIFTQLQNILEAFLQNRVNDKDKEYHLEKSDLITSAS